MMEVVEEFASGYAEFMLKKRKITPQSHRYSVLEYLLHLSVAIGALPGQEGNDSGLASGFRSHMQWIF
jgi:hypothetical protein